MLDVIGSVLGKVLDLVGKAVQDKDKKNEITKELELAANEIEKLHHKDVQSARELAIAETKLSLKDPRAWVRPAWAFTALTMWVITLNQKGFVFEYWDYGIVSAVASFYFGSRAVEKIKSIRSKTNDVLGNWLK